MQPTETGSEVTIEGRTDTVAEMTIQADAAAEVPMERQTDVSEEVTVDQVETNTDEEVPMELGRLTGLLCVVLDKRVYRY